MSRFWQCPNGRECKYRHALPPGYVLKSQMKLLLEEEKVNHMLCSSSNTYEIGFLHTYEIPLVAHYTYSVSHPFMHDPSSLSHQGVLLQSGKPV